jgi:HK97 family phage portal protein
MRHSVVWSARHLRADLISLMTPQVYRDVNGVAFDAPKPSVLIDPWEIAAGQPMGIGEWMYTTQMALDAFGNNVGIVHARDGLGMPTKIEPVDPETVTYKVKGSKILEYRIAGSVEDSKFIWHERQHTVPGFPVGLSPLTNAALALSAGLSAQEFAVDWFQNGAVPKAILRNGKKDVSAETAQLAKDRFKATMQNGDIFVTGTEWEYSPVSVKASEASFIEQMQYTDVELCRFFGVPADLLDVASMNASAVTYASISQRNLQLLVMNLGGAVKRRDDALSRLVPGGRYVKLSRSAVLAMDDKSRADLFASYVSSRIMTPDQVRAIEDMPPLVEADYAQFERLFGARTPNQPQTAGGN